MNTKLFSASLLLTAACTLGSGIAANNGPKQGAILLASGTVPTSTSGVATSDIEPSMNVVSDDVGVHVYAALIYPAGNFLPLAAGDTLTASAAGQTIPLTLDPNEPETRYTGSLPVLTAGANVTISFLRSGGEPSAPNNVVAIDPPFTLSAPDDGGFVLTSLPTGLGRIGDPVVTLSAAIPTTAPALVYQVWGPCVPGSATGTDYPTLSMNPPALDLLLVGLSNLLDPSAQNCAITAEVRGETKGTWDPAFNTDPTADVFPGLQARTIQLIENPAVATNNAPDAG